MDNKTISQQAFLLNTAYMMSMAIDLIVRYCETQNSITREGMDREQKHRFNQYRETLHRACVLHEQVITQYLYDADRVNNYKNIQLVREEANEIARLLLLYRDRNRDIDIEQKIHAFIRQQPNDGYVDEELLQHFYLKKL